MRYLIRLAKSRVDEWVNGQGLDNPQRLTDCVFRPTPAHRKEFIGLFEDSTYLVDGVIEEARVATAHLLAGNNPVMETRYVLRILASDAAAVGLRVDDSSIGRTGIPWIDFRHRDLVGTRDQFQLLVRHILERLREGHDRIRRVGSVQDAWSFHEFLTCPVTEIPTRTKDIINCVLGGIPLRAVAPDVAQTQAEITNLNLPDEIVSLRAHCLVEAGHGAGSDLETWAVALKQLREEYRKNYPHARVWP